MRILLPPSAFRLDLGSMERTAEQGQTGPIDDGEVPLEQSL